MKSRTRRIKLSNSIRSSHNINGGGEKKINFTINHSPSRWRLVEEHARRHLEKKYLDTDKARYFTEFPWSWYQKPFYTYRISIIVKPPKPKTFFSKQRNEYLFDIDISEIETNIGYGGVQGFLREIRGEPPVLFFEKLTKLKKHNLKVNEFITLFINDAHTDIDEENDANNCINLLLIEIQKVLNVKFENLEKIEFTDNIYFMGLYLIYLKSQIENYKKNKSISNGHFVKKQIPPTLTELEINEIIQSNLRSIPLRYKHDES